MAEETTFFTKKKQQIFAYRMIIAWITLFSINTLCSAILAALAGKYWSQVDVQDKFVIVVAVIMNWTGVLQVFLLQASKKISHGENPLDTEPKQPEIKQ